MGLDRSCYASIPNVSLTPASRLIVKVLALKLFKLFVHPLAI